MRGQAAGVYCWNTVPGSDEVVYQTANNGYPVILCNVGNFYMDMAYNGHPDERGLDWGGYVDESVSFSMLPFSIYRSLRVDMAGNPIDLNNAEKGKTALTEIGKKHIMGVQGQLFAETIRSFDWRGISSFPQNLRAGRTWLECSSGMGKPVRRAGAAGFQSGFWHFIMRKSASSEMPYWAKNGINFRLPQPGLLVKDGNLYANVAIDGAEVRYTTDGSEPTAQSTLWKEPVKCGSLVVKAKTFYQGKESLTIILNVE